MCNYDLLLVCMSKYFQKKSSLTQAYNKSTTFFATYFDSPEISSLWVIWKKKGFSSAVCVARSYYKWALTTDEESSRRRNSLIFSSVWRVLEEKEYLTITSYFRVFLLNPYPDDLEAHPHFLKHVVAIRYSGWQGHMIPCGVWLSFRQSQKADGGIKLFVVVWIICWSKWIISENLKCDNLSSNARH